MVVVIDRAGAALERLDSGRGASFELVVVVAVQEIVLAVVLVLDDGLGLAKPGLKGRAGTGALGVSAIGIAAPFQIGVGEIGLVGPKTLVDHRLEPRAIGPRLGAKDPELSVLAALAVVDPEGNLDGLRHHPEEGEHPHPEDRAGAPHGERSCDAGHVPHSDGSGQ